MQKNDASIIKGLLTKDQRVVPLLMAQYGSYIYSICYNVLKLKPESEEACQDVFLKIINKIADYNYTSAFKSWIFTIAFRTAIDYKRKRKQNSDETALINSASDYKADDELNKSEEKVLIEKLLSHLSEDEEMLIRLFYLNEMSVKEMIEATGLGESNIKIKLFRARKELALHIDKYYQIH